VHQLFLIFLLTIVRAPTILCKQHTGEAIRLRVRDIAASAESLIKKYRKMDTRGIAGQIARIRELANSLIKRGLEDRRIKGIVPAHGPVLLFLFQQSKPVPIKAVVESARRVKSTVTVMINTLEKHGYIQKTPCETDNRVTFVELTPKGRNFRKDFDEISRILLTKLYGDMGKKDRERLVKQLDRIEQNLTG
jgi:DNA-binding MarR family transcriptional regulator